MVLCKTNSRIAGEMLRVGLKSSEKALYLFADLLVPREPPVSRRNLTGLQLHFQHILARDPLPAQLAKSPC